MFSAQPFSIMQTATKSYESVKPNEGSAVEKEAKNKNKEYDERCIPNNIFKATTLPSYLNRDTPSPSLLCAYEYFLNEEQNKTISIGYNPDDNFKAQFVIRSYEGGKTYPNFVSFTLNDFKKLFCERVEEFFNPFCNLSTFYDKTNQQEKKFHDDAVQFIQEGRNEKIKQGYLIPVLETTNFSLYEKYSTEGEPLLSISGWNLHNNDFITLTKKEVDRMQEMHEFFETIWINTRSASYEVQEYYWEYVKQCNMKKLEILPESCFFSSRNHKATINVFRLFNEIPIYCRRKLYNDLALFSKNNYEQYKRL